MIKFIKKIQLLIKQDNTGKLTTGIYIDSKTAGETVSTLPNSKDIRFYGRGLRNLVSIVNKKAESFKFEFTLTGCEEKPRLIGWGLLLNPVIDWYYQQAIPEGVGLEVEEGIGLDVGRAWAALISSNGYSLKGDANNILIGDYGDAQGLEVDRI